MNPNDPSPDSAPEPNQPEPTQTPPPVESSAPVEPATPTTNEAVVTGGKPSRKLYAIIAAVVAVLLLGGSALAYMALKNSPDMILQDAFYNTAKQTQGSYKGTMDLGSGDEAGKLMLKGAANKDLAMADFTFEGAMLQGKTVSANLVSTKDTFYVKLNDVRSLVSSLMGDSPEMMQMFDGLLSKVDGKWVSVTEKDLKDVFGIETTGEQNECVRKALTTFQNDKKQQQELHDQYNKNKFVTLKQQADESVDGRNAYKFGLTIDEAKAQAFEKEVKNTTLYKEVTKCSDVKTSDDSDTTGDSNSDDTMPTVTVWIDKDSRTLRKVEVKSDKEKLNIQLTLDFSSPVNITVPKADTNVKELQAEIEKLQSQFMPTADLEAIDNPVLGTQHLRL